VAKRRDSNIFSLSFLDIMSCGFGAVILIYITINHGSVTEGVQITPESMAEVRAVEAAIESEKLNHVELNNTLALTETDIITSQARIQEILAEINAITEAQSKIESSQSVDEDAIAQLKIELQSLVDETAALEASIDATEGNALRNIAGQGDRQYLTGLNMGGEHILILLDSSASMLDETIVNIIRRRNLDETSQRQSAKWQRSLRIVEWIAANMPANANFQIIQFSTRAEAADSATNNRWLAAKDDTALDQSLSALQATTPKGGSSLHAAFLALNQLSPAPDNVFLITDGLPTQGNEPPNRNLITARDRQKLFREAVDLLPLEIPINVILMPMEGDPMASPSFWQLAQITGGAFLSPAKDWP